MPPVSPLQLTVKPSEPLHVLAFLLERYPQQSVWVKQTELHRAFSTWRKEQGLTGMSRDAFFNRLQQLGLKKRVKQQVWWQTPLIVPSTFRIGLKANPDLPLSLDLDITVGVEHCKTQPLIAHPTLTAVSMTSHTAALSHEHDTSQPSAPQHKVTALRTALAQCHLTRSLCLTSI